MRLFLDAVDIGGLSCQAQNDVADGRLAAGIAVTVEQRKQESAGAAVHILAAEEHAVPRHENMVKNNIGIRIAKTEASLIMLAFAKRMKMDDLLYAFMIS